MRTERHARGCGSLAAKQVEGVRLHPKVESKPNKPHRLLVYSRLPVVQLTGNPAVCVPEDGALTTKPATMTWEEAAALPLAANIALYFIRDLGNIQAGQNVVITVDQNSR